MDEEEKSSSVEERNEKTVNVIEEEDSEKDTENMNGTLDNSEENSETNEGIEAEAESEMKSENDGKEESEREEENEDEDENDEKEKVKSEGNKESEEAENNETESQEQSEEIEKETENEEADEKTEAVTSGATKATVRKRYKDDFEWDKGILGQGAFGEVKRAKDIETGVVYAIKILNKQHIIQQKKVEWVNREKFLLDRLRHPNISSLFFTFSDPQCLYFVLEYCSGGELLDHIRRVKAFDVPVARFYAAEIILALEFMHSKGVAHRDLKPENILLGQHNHVKLVDFGTARDFGTNKSARSKSFVGTAEYVCPELLVSKEAGLAADLWSFGVTLFQMLAGKAPFKAASEYLIFKLIQSREFEYPQHFPEEAKDLVDQLLELDPEKRLGNRPGGYAELKAHTFFEGVDWENLSSQTPPEIVPPAVLPVFIPKVTPQSQDSKEEEEKKRTQEERKKKLEEQKSSVWAPMLQENELIVESSLVVKKKGWSKVKRQLIMTDLPRIFYVDADKMAIKGEIEWSDEISVDVKNKKHFFIRIPARSYDLQELQGNAAKWKTAIDAQKASAATAK